MRGPRELQHPVENATRRFTCKRLPRRNPAPAVPPRSHQNVCLARRAQKLVDETKRDAEVGIHKKNPVPARPQHPGLHGMPLAVRGRIRENFEPGIPGGFLPRHFLRAIASGFDHDQKFPRFRGERPPDFPDRGRESHFLVSGGNDNTDARCLIRHGL